MVKALVIQKAHLLMSHTQKTSLITRLHRITRLIACIWRAGRTLSHLPHTASQAERNQTLAEISHNVLRTLNIQLIVDTPAAQADIHGALVVANHISWLDIFAISALCPSSFIAKQEIKQWPIIGRMVVNAGTVFINRENRKDIDTTNQTIAQTLQQGQSVSFFPEARTSLGNGVLPFKAALFQSAIDAQMPVQVIALRYYNQHGERTTAPSFAEVNLLVSLWRTVSEPQLSIHLDFAPLISPTKDRFALKEQAEQFVVQKVGNIEKT